MSKPNFEELEKKIDINFNDKNILLNAFVHRSYLNENRSFKLPSNERLEFLGDACLELITSEYLFDNYPQEPEGVLTNYRSALVNTQSLADSARDLSLGKYLLLSKGEENGGGRDSDYLLANTFEAFLGALYLDQGIQETTKIVKNHVLNKLNQIIEQKKHRDSKSQLQEIAQAELGYTPEYVTLGQWGPDHNKTFRIGVKVNGKTIGIGTGMSKQKAEQQAAEHALENWSEDE